jgi:hypothetical protein
LKELLKKQQKEVQEMSFTLKAVLELQIFIVQDVQRNIEAILQDGSKEKTSHLQLVITNHWSNFSSQQLQPFMTH